MNKKKIFIGLLGALFIIAGLYFRFTDPGGAGSSFEYFGIGTWIAGIVFFGGYPKYKEIISFLVGLIMLHEGVLFILKYQFSNPILPGLLAFISGIVIILSSGFSDYLKNRKNK